MIIILICLSFIGDALTGWIYPLQTRTFSKKHIFYALGILSTHSLPLPPSPCWFRLVVFVCMPLWIQYSYLEIFGFDRIVLNIYIYIYIYIYICVCVWVCVCVCVCVCVRKNYTKMKIWTHNGRDSQTCWHEITPDLKIDLFFRGLFCFYSNIMYETCH